MPTPSDLPVEGAGSFLDGDVPVRRPVEVRLEALALIIEGEGDLGRIWRWTEIEAVPVAGKTLRLRLVDGEARLDIEDAALASAARARLPRRRSTGPALLRGALMGIAGIAVMALLVDRAPAWIAPRLSSGAREMLARATSGDLLDQGAECSDLRAKASVMRLLDPHLERSEVADGRAPGPISGMLEGERDGADIHTVHLMRGRGKSALLDRPNAFALPGGHVVVTMEMVRMAGSPEALAGVLAHELGHVANRDPERSLLRSVAISGLLLLLGGRGELSGGAVLAQLAYSRDAERAADRHAKDMLARAGLPSEPLAELLERLEAQHGDASLSWLSTHPATTERVAALREAPVPGVRSALDPEAWRALQNACRN